MKAFSKVFILMFAMIMCSCSDGSNEAMAQATMSQKLYVTIDGVTQPVTLYDNAATRELVNKLQAYRLGFQSSQHFNRYFKRCTGMTPTEYRKSSRHTA